MPSEAIRSSLDNLRDQVQRWVSVGIVSSEQGERIVHFEQEMGESAAAAGAPGAPPVRRLSPVAELVSYLGIVLVLASGGLFVARLWNSLGLGGRVVVGAVIALLGFFGGYAVSRLGDEGTTRLGWFLWLCGTGGVAMSTATAVDRIGSHNPGWTLLVTGLVVLALSVGLWRNLERPLQFLSSVVGLGLTVGGLVNLVNWQPSVTTANALLWLVAVALGLLAINIIHPSLVATVLAQGGLFITALAVTTSSRALGMALGLVGAAAGVGLGLSKRRPPVVAVGVLSFFVFVVRLLSFYLRGPGTMLVAFVLGVALVGVVIWRATQSRGVKGGGTTSEARERTKTPH